MRSSIHAETVIGFDAREAYLEPGRLWTPARRRTYLLRDDVEKPLSVDALVWPSVFHELPLPDCGGVSRDLWDALDDVRAALVERRAPAHRIVAVSWMTDDPDAKGGPGRGAPVPSALGPEWTLLGYDVADAGCLSGLSNCGYSPLEREALAPAWAGKLDAAHLFTTPEDAFAFRRVADTRASEHAPFFVYALRVLQGT